MYICSWMSGSSVCRHTKVQLSATRCSCIAILWVNLVSFAAIEPSYRFW